MEVAAIKNKYSLLWSTMKVHPDKVQHVHNLASIILSNKSKYTHISDLIRKTYPNSGIPWYFIAIVHYMECNLSFLFHLHNGDPLSARTKHVPAGRPIAGHPPFSFEQSAIDALTFKGLQNELDWTIPNILYKLENFNGMGYTLYHNMNSPYLWAGSDKYVRGKYVSDGKFDPNAVSSQIGSALILKQLV